jgi:hypothetical protein
MQWVSTGAKMYIYVCRTVCLIVNLASLELDIFLDHKPVTLTTVTSFTHPVSAHGWEGSCYKFPGPTKLHMFLSSSVVLFTACSGEGGRQKFFKQWLNPLSATLHTSHHASQGLHHMLLPYPNPWPCGQMWTQFTEIQLSFRKVPCILHHARCCGQIYVRGTCKLIRDVYVHR